MEYKKQTNKNKINEQTKPNQTEKWLPEGKGLRKGVKGVSCMMTKGNEIFGGEHTVGYMAVEIPRCTREAYVML